MTDVFLIDARNCVYRHGWTRSLLRNSAGVPTGAMFGFLQCLIRLKNFYPDAKFVMCWDGKDPWKSWRHQYCKTYKASRHKPGVSMSQEVKNILGQIPAIKKAIDILGIPQFEVPCLEADDLIGIISKELSKKKTVRHIYIYSMDKDFFQLIDGKVSVVRDLIKDQKCKAFQMKDVIKEYGVASKDWVKYRSLIGDPSDGIKSPFRGVGKVTALKLLAQGLDPSKKQPELDIEKKYSKYWKQCRINYVLSKIIRNADSARLEKTVQKQLKDIVKNLDYRSTVEDKQAAARQLDKLFTRYELNSLMEQRFKFYKLW